MKKRNLVTLSVVIIVGLSAAVSAQRRPARSKPRPQTIETIPTPSQTAPTPTPPSSAQGFFQAGVRCPSEDVDCQISNFTKAINLGLANKELLGKRAAAYMRRGDFEKAIADLTQVITLDPNSTEGFKLRGKAIYSIRGDLSKALADFNSAIDLEPKDVEAYVLRAMVQARSGKREKADSDFAKAISIDANYAPAYLRRGAVRMHRDEKAGLADLTKAIELSLEDRKERGEAYYLRGTLYRKQNNLDLAVSDIVKAIEADGTETIYYAYRADLYRRLEKHDLSLRDFTKAIELRPEYGYYRVKRAETYLSLKEPQKALADLDHVIAANSPWTAMAYGKRAELSLSEKQFDKAIEDATKALNQDPKNDEALSVRMAAVAATSGPADAVYKADFELWKGLVISNSTAAIAADPGNAEAYRKRANGYTMSGQYAQAVSDYEKIVELEGNRARSHADLATALYLRRAYLTPADFTSFPSIIGSISKAIELEPKNDTYYAQRAGYYLNLASNSEVEANRDRAVADYKKAIEIAPKVASHYSGLSTISVLRRNLPEALTILDQGISAAPETPEPYYYRGVYYRFHSVNLTNAIADYKKCGELASEENPFRKVCTDQITSVNDGIKQEKERELALKECKKQRRRAAASAIFGAIASGALTAATGQVVILPSGERVTCN